MDEWIKKFIYAYNGILFKLKKEENPTIYDNIDGPGEGYAKWNNLDMERQIQNDLIYMWNLKSSNS